MQRVLKAKKKKKKREVMELEREKEHEMCRCTMTDALPLSDVCVRLYFYRLLFVQHSSRTSFLFFSLWQNPTPSFVDSSWIKNERSSARTNLNLKLVNTLSFENWRSMHANHTVRSNTLGESQFNQFSSKKKFNRNSKWKITVVHVDEVIGAKRIGYPITRG